MKRQKQRGSSLIEFALIVPLLFLLVVNVVNFAGFFYAWIVVAHAGRSAAQYMVTGPAYAGYGSSDFISALPTTAAQIQSILTTCPQGDMCAPSINLSKVTVTVCSNNNGVQEAPGNCLSPAGYVDPELTTSVIATVSVSYLYCPLIPSWDVPALGIHSSLPRCNSDGTGGMTIHRTAAMRMIQ